MDAQWNHCSRTYCNKNFRGWIAGFNPFCQLIEIRTLGYPRILATGSYSPLTGINIPKIDHQQLFPKRKIMYHGNDDKYGGGPREIRPLVWSPKVTSTVSARRQPDALKVIWPWRLPLACVGLSWLVLPVLPCWAPKSKKKLSGPIFFSSPRLLCNLIPRQNELAKPPRYEPRKN